MANSKKIGSLQKSHTCSRAASRLTAEVLTLRGLVTYYVLVFIHLESRRVDIAGITVHPDERWMRQIARNVTMEGCGALRDCVAISCTIATPSTVSPSERSLNQAGSSRSCCPRAART